MDIRLSKLGKYLIILLILLIPFTHKEHFSVFDQDLVYSKFVFVAIAILGVWFFLKSHGAYLKDIFFLLFASIVVFQLLSLFQSLDQFNTWRIIAFQGTVLFAYPVFKELMKSREVNLKFLMVPAYIIFSVVFLFLLVQIYLQETFSKAIGGVWPVPGFATRYGATFWDVNHFGIYLVALILVSAGLFLSVKRKSPLKIVIPIILVLAFIALYFTKSRSSMIGLFVAGFVFVYGYSQNVDRPGSKLLNRIGPGIISLVMAVVPITLLILLKDHIRDFFLYRAVSFFSHLYLLKSGIMIGFQNFFTGIGANSFHEYFRNSELAKPYYFIDPAAISLRLPLHNLWLESFTETGVIAFIFFLALWFFLLVGLWRLFAKNKDYFALGLMCAIIAFLVGGIMYSYKSEFFWVWVLISAGYISVKATASTLKANISKILGANFRQRKFALIIFLILSLAWPLAFIFAPLNPEELEIYLTPALSDIPRYSYQYLLHLFRYIFGNYSYVGRGLSLFFYIPSILFLYGIFRRKTSSIKSLLLTSILINFIGIFNPIIAVSVDWYWTFVFLLLIYGFFVIWDLILSRTSRKKSAHLNHPLFRIRYLIIVLVLCVAGSIKYSALYFSYGSDWETFVMETAHNWHFFESPTFYIDKSVNIPLAHYYCDQVIVENFQYGITPCEFNIRNLTPDLISPTGTQFYMGSNLDDLYSLLLKVGDPKLKVTLLQKDGYGFVYAEQKL